jgi:hypothetical protein
MAWGTKKTVHAGAKKETGAFYGRKADAKRGSSSGDVRTASLPSALDSYSY